MSYWTSFISCKSRPFRELIEHLWPQWSIWIGRFHYNCLFPVYNSFKCCVYVCPLVLQSIYLHYFPLSYATWNMVEPWQQRIAVAVKVAALNFPSVIMDCLVAITGSLTQKLQYFYVHLLRRYIDDKYSFFHLFQKTFAATCINLHLRQ